MCLFLSLHGGLTSARQTVEKGSLTKETLLKKFGDIASNPKANQILPVRLRVSRVAPSLHFYLFTAAQFTYLCGST